MNGYLLEHEQGALADLEKLRTLVGYQVAGVGVVQRLDQQREVDLRIFRLILLLIFLDDIAPSMSGACKRFGLFNIEVYNLEIFNVGEILFFHDGQHLGDMLLWCPDKHQALTHKFAGLYF